MSKSRGKSARKTSRTGYTSDHQSDRRKTAQLLRTSSPESQAPVTTKKTSGTRQTTKRDSRSKRTSKTDESYSEEAAQQMQKEKRSKGPKRKTRITVSPYSAEMDSPVTPTSRNEAETTKSQRRLQRNVPQTSTPQSEHRVYEGRLTRSRIAATTSRERVSRYFQELQQQSEEESEQPLSANDRRKSRSRLERHPEQQSAERSQSAESSESDNTRRQMAMTLGSARRKTSKQIATKPSSSAKRKATSKNLPVKETASKKAVQLIPAYSGTDPEDNQTLATLQHKKTKDKPMRRAAQKKETSKVTNKQSREELNVQSDQELFVTQKMSTVQPSQISPTQQSDPDRQHISQSNEEEYLT